MILIIYCQSWTSTLRVSRHSSAFSYTARNSASKMHEYLRTNIRYALSACEFLPTYDVIHTYDHIESLLFHW